MREEYLWANQKDISMQQAIDSILQNPAFDWNISNWERELLNW